MLKFFIILVVSVSVSQNFWTFKTKVIIPDLFWTSEDRESWKAENFFQMHGLTNDQMSFENLWSKRCDHLSDLELEHKISWENKNI